MDHGHSAYHCDDIIILGFLSVVPPVSHNSVGDNDCLHGFHHQRQSGFPCAGTAALPGFDFAGAGGALSDGDDRFLAIPVKRSSKFSDRPCIFSDDSVSCLRRFDFIFFHDFLYPERMAFASALGDHSAYFKFYAIFCVLALPLWVWYVTAKSLTYEGVDPFAFIPDPRINGAGFFKGVFGNLLGFKWFYPLLLGIPAAFVLSKDRRLQIVFFLAFLKQFEAIFEFV